MAMSKEDILEAVGAMSVMELNDLVKAFEEKFGVSAAAMAVAGPAGGAAAGDWDRSCGGSEYALLSDITVPGDHGALLVLDGVCIFIYSVTLRGNRAQTDDEEAVSGGTGAAICCILSG